MTAPTVFISYSHDTPEHENRVLVLSDRLRDDGIDVNIDQYQTAPPEGWPFWMEKEIRNSQFVLLVCTETYLKRVMKEDSGKGLGAMWESTIIYQYLYNTGGVNEKFIPITFGRDNSKYVPMPLQPATRYDVSTEEGYEALYRRITDQPYTTKPTLGAVKKLARRERKSETSNVDVSLAKLPSTSPVLFGRDDELKELDDAWANPHINAVSLVAWGGVGKSALVNKWLSQMGADNYRGAERVYGWSFYSQGAAEGRQVSADQFIASALAWFGDPELANSSASPWDKGERLAELVKESRALIILDGLEPLQNPPPVETGRIKDPALVAFLRELARQNRGLVLITTRLAVDDLKDFIGSTTIERGLEALSDEAGAEYLKHLGVDGTEDERKEASHDFGGHALALTLLGSYLKVVHRGDIRKRKEIPHVMDEQKQGKHARRVMQSYEVFLKGKPELDTLCLMGLFDRPAEKGALDALRKEPAIEGLTNSLQKLNDANWQYAVNNLRELRLLADLDAHEPDALDCHPLLREHFGEQLKEANPAAWREGNNRLYEYYKASAKELPDTLQEMAPLFAAVLHGCQAGRHQEALSEVYWNRIQRREESFNAKKLGAFSAEIAALSGFFDGTSWQKPVDGLSESAKAFILGEAGYGLRALGRLAEAAQPMQASLDAAITQKDWKNAAIQANNLSELYLTIGDVMQALVYAEQSVLLANRDGSEKWRMVNRTVRANTLHQAGRFTDAEVMFREAEEIQKKRQPQLPLLYSTTGFQYCDLLLSQGEYAEVRRRASQTLVWVEQVQQDILSAALDNLSLGRVLFQIRINAERVAPVQNPLIYFNRAIDGLRQVGGQDDIPRGLLARAEYYRVTGDLNKSQKDLDEAFSISTRGGMGLYLADCHLEYARLALTKGDKAKAREHWQIAKDSIEKMGYHRRDKEVEELEKQLK